MNDDIVKAIHETGAMPPAAGSCVKHDAAKVPLGLLPPGPLTEIAWVLDHGAKKYGRDNWRGGMKWTRLYSAVLRHLFAWARGENNDPETGRSHLAHAACALLFLLEYRSTHPELDDR
jgi:hypothetical protein